MSSNRSNGPAGPKNGPWHAWEKMAGSWKRIAGSSWLGPVAKAAGTTALVVGLAWLGDQHAARATPWGPKQAQREAAAARMGRGTWHGWEFRGTTWRTHRKGHAKRSKRKALTHEKKEPSSGKAREKGTPTSHSKGLLPDGRVILNEANERDLCRLPGVGPSRAKRILALRKRLGRFKSLRQLTRVRGIGYRTVRKLSKHLVLDAPVKRREETARTKGQKARK